MAYRSNSGDIKKIILLILLIIVLVGVGILVIDFVGNIFGVSVPFPGLKSVKSATFKKKIKSAEDPYLLEREELGKFEEKLLLREEQIDNKEREIFSKESETNKKLESLIEKEKELEKKEKLLSSKELQYQDKKKNIREQAVKIYNMPPNDSVALLEKQDDSDVVDILREIDAYSEELGRQSLSPYLLKLLGDKNRDKAATVLRKLKYSAGDKDSSVESLDGDIPPP